jgi:hypothetical protein
MQMLWNTIDKSLRSGDDFREVTTTSSVKVATGSTFEVKPKLN